MSIKTERFKEYFVKIADSFSEISEIEKDWRKLAQGNALINIYIDPQYFTSQFDTRSPNSQPHILLFYNNTDPVALIVGKTTHRKLPIKFGYLKFYSPTVKILEIEIDGILTNNNSEINEHIHLYLKDLQKNKKFQLIELLHFSDRNQIWKLLTDTRINQWLLKFQGKEYICEIRDSETGTQLVDHKAKTLRNFRRADKIIDKKLNRIILKTYVDLEHIDEFLAAANNICKNSYHCDLGVGIEDNLFWRKKIGDLIHENYFLGFILYSDSKPIAYNFGLVYQNYFFGFNMSFDLNYRKYQPGTYLLRRIIEKLVELKIDYYHLGYGEAAYKKLYSNLSYEEATFQLYNNSLRSKLIYFMILFSKKFNDNVIILLGKLGIIDKIKKAWRSRISL